MLISVIIYLLSVLGYVNWHFHFTLGRFQFINDFRLALFSIYVIGCLIRYRLVGWYDMAVCVCPVKVNGCVFGNIKNDTWHLHVNPSHINFVCTWIFGKTQNSSCTRSSLSPDLGPCDSSSLLKWELNLKEEDLTRWIS